MSLGTVLAVTLVTVGLSELVAPQDHCTSGSCLCPHEEDHEGRGYEERGYENVERDDEHTAEDWQKSIVDVIKHAGYTVETHEIRTADGYLLSYHRIPRGKNDDPNAKPEYNNYFLSKKPPILLQHGLICSSASWVTSPHAIAYVLADAGYDVWIGNARGNTFSRKHVKLDPDKHSKFWDFSWNEMGYYDLPAAIDYILDKTGKPQLYYIGHSMGTTMYFVLGATRAPYMAKVKAAVLLSPVMYPYHVRSPFAKFVPLISLLVNCVSMGNEMMANKGVMTWVNNNICRNPKFQFACRGMYFAMCGFDKEQFDEDQADIIFRFTPAGLSRKVLLHFIQIKKQSNGFRQYDYGDYNYGNFWMYGDYRAPVYELERLTAPMYIYYAENDLLIAPKDVMLTVKNLQNVKELIKVPLEKFSHSDFMWAKQAKELVYDSVVKTLDELSDN